MPIDYDAWNRPKSVTDKSIFHGMFTYNIPKTTWYERINNVVQSDFTNCSSVDGELRVTAGATLNDKTNLRSFRNPRYQPNRGHLYSTACIFTNPAALMNRSFGIGTNENGVFFSLESGILYAVIRTTIASVTEEEKTPIDIFDIDLSKGNIFDIQFQWRGTGNYKFFINNKEVKRIKYLGKLTRLSISNPALPVCFESENLGDNDEMAFGCVDVTSEGGDDSGKTYGSVEVGNESGQVGISGFNQPIIAIRSKLTINSLINTRDALALYLTAYSDQRSFVRVWVTRDFTAITENDQSWQDYGDGHLEYIAYDVPDVASPMTFDTTKAVRTFGARVDQDQSYTTPALFQNKTEIYQTPGDMFVFTMHRETGGATNVGLTYEFAEEI